MEAEERERCRSCGNVVTTQQGQADVRDTQYGNGTVIIAPNIVVFYF